MIEGAKAKQSQVQAKGKAKVTAKVKAVAKPKANGKAVAKPKKDGDKGSFHAMCVCDIKWHVCIN